jgi:small ligand-binding sensory domain FIST
MNESHPYNNQYTLLFLYVLRQTFHVLGADVPDDYGPMSPDTWKRSVGLSGIETTEDGSSAIFLLPSPAFQNDLDTFTRGLENKYPGSKIFGAIASTVSSLSRARLFRHDSSEDCIQTLADGCVGFAMSGDIEVKTMIAQGAKPVGGVYQIVKGQECTISSIALDESATELMKAAEAEMEDEEEDEEEDIADTTTKKAQFAAAYAKASIPKPVLAEANFIMKTLSDDDQTFMRKTILVGLERGGSIGRTSSELARLAEGKGHRFTVYQVASASMKDGSVTLSLGSVDIKPGTRLRFFVRESDFAKKEVEALWTGFKRRTLTETTKGSPSFQPTGCFLFPTLDRGSKFFFGKTGFESGAASQFLPTVPCISGFFSLGVIGALEKMDSELGTKESISLYGSASEYILFGSSK